MTKTKSLRKANTEHHEMEGGSSESTSEGKAVETEGATAEKKNTTEKIAAENSNLQTPEIRRSARQAQREKEGKGWSLKKLIVDFGTHKAEYKVEVNDTEAPSTGKKRKKESHQKASEKSESENDEMNDTPVISKRSRKGSQKKPAEKSENENDGFEKGDKEVSTESKTQAVKNNKAVSAAGDNNQQTEVSEVTATDQTSEVSEVTATDQTSEVSEVTATDQTSAAVEKLKTSVDKLAEDKKTDSEEQSIPEQTKSSENKKKIELDEEIDEIQEEIKVEIGENEEDTDGDGEEEEVGEEEIIDGDGDEELLDGDAEEGLGDEELLDGDAEEEDVENNGEDGEEKLDDGEENDVIEIHVKNEGEASSPLTIDVSDDDYGDDDDDYDDVEEVYEEEVFALDGSQRVRVKKEQRDLEEVEMLFDEEYVKTGNLKKGQNVKVPEEDLNDYYEMAAVDGQECGKNTKVICPLCQKSVLRTYLKHHLKKTHVRGRYPCDECNKVFQAKGYLTEHVRYVHQGIRKVRKQPGEGSNSPGMQMSLESKAILESAEIYGEEDGLNTKVICPKCDKVLLRTYLVKHNQKIHGDRRYPCPQCDKVFQYNGYLSDHIRYVHKRIKKKSQLNKYAKDPAIVQMCEGAVYVDSNQEKVRVQCPKCPRIVQEEYLAKHMKFAHSEKVLACDQCDKTFTCSRFLYDHRKYVHIDKKTECEICGKLFKGFPAKEKHKKVIHSDIKRYQCAVCGEKFRTSIECNRHMYSHEDPTIYCYPCTKCERRFRSHKMMNLHIRQVHKRLGRLQCKWPGCDKVLNDKATFKKHYCIHTGEKPNQCPLCERRFIQRVALKYHLKTQHKTVDYEKLMPPLKQGDHREKRPDSDLNEMMVEPLPMAAEDMDDEGETTTIQVEVPEGTDIQSLIAGSNVIEGTPVELSDSALVSDLINTINQSSGGGPVPEALQHVFEGGNKTIVIYYQ